MLGFPPLWIRQLQRRRLIDTNRRPPISFQTSRLQRRRYAYNGTIEARSVRSCGIFENREKGGLSHGDGRGRSDTALPMLTKVGLLQCSVAQSAANYCMNRSRC